MELPIQEFEEKVLERGGLGVISGVHGLQSAPETVLETKKVLPWFSSQVCAYP